MMPTVLFYILGASPNPHAVERVPWRVDDRQILLGPCKKPLREEISLG